MPLSRNDSHKAARIAELNDLLKVAREQMIEAKRLGLRSLQQSIRYDIRRWKVELSKLAYSS